MRGPVQRDARKNLRLALAAGCVSAGMIGLSYASVPLYAMFCKVTGYGGTTQRAEQAPDKTTEQVIAVRFDANASSALGWNFRPSQTVMKVKIGEQNLAHYTAKNMGAAEATGSAIFNVSPGEAGLYFNKIQCFCFTEQTLKPGESADFPVTFFVDPAILDDPDAKGIKEITLSYTFYPASKPVAQNAGAKTLN
jgi:cytochrome c oxidase assembly protein subunit 11